MSNTELVAAIIGGEVHQYAEIVRRFDARVRQTINRDVDDPATREDVVQETFYRAFTQLDKLRDAEQLENWLVMIARNCVKDHFRKTNRRRQKELSGGLQKFADNDAMDIAKQPSSWIWQEVDGLAPHFAQVLRLRYRHSMTYGEIAQQLDLPESTVRGRIFEARKALKQRLINHRLFP